MNTSNLLNEINNMNEKELNKYIIKRLNILKEANNDLKVLGHLTPFSFTPPTFGLVGIDTKIYYTDDDNYCVITKDDYMFLFVEYLRKKKITTIQGVLIELASFLNEYFNGDKTDNKKNILNKRNGKERMGVKDISLLKNRGSATSIDYAVLAQNILTFLELDSFLCIGNIKKDGSIEKVAFNLIKSNEIYYLLDYYNNTKVYDSEKRFLGYFPFQSSISSEDAISLLNEEKIVEFNDYIRVWNNITYAIRNIGMKRKYCVGNLLELESLRDLDNAV